MADEKGGQVGFHPLKKRGVKDFPESGGSRTFPRVGGQGGFPPLDSRNILPPQLLTDIFPNLVLFYPLLSIL